MGLVQVCGAAPRAREGESSDYGDSMMRRVAAIEVAEEGAPLCALQPGPGDRLGGDDGRRFGIVAEIGSGSMSVVFRAVDHLLERTVAIKLMLRQKPRPGSDVVALSHREARAIARLDHRNVIRVFDVGMWRGVPFLVMEHHRGEPLASLLRRGRLGAGMAVEIMSQIAGGLAHAHEHGVVHRDLKPSNVFVAEDGCIKLLDFGLARSMTAGGAAGGEGEADALSRAGTPPYMAPEQWRGEPQDARTDVWAMGVVLFEMLSGRRPYHEASRVELRARVSSGAPVPSIRTYRHDVPAAIEAIVVRALEKDPIRRFQAAEEMRRALEQARGAEG